MQYVGQTKNKFSNRWNNHRSFWNKFNVKDNNDQAALLKHFYKFHFDAFNGKLDITECYMVIFVEHRIKLYWIGVKINGLIIGMLKLILIEFLCLIIAIEF